jgi:hypothetical protein
VKFPVFGLLFYGWQYERIGRAGASAIRLGLALLFVFASVDPIGATLIVSKNRIGAKLV